jgi:hypothetical protein
VVDEYFTFKHVKCKSQTLLLALAHWYREETPGIISYKDICCIFWRRTCHRMAIMEHFVSQGIKLWQIPRWENEFIRIASAFLLLRGFQVHWQVPNDMCICGKKAPLCFLNTCFPFLLLLSSFFFLLGFELRASHLLGRCSTTWATPPALPFFLQQTVDLWEGQCARQWGFHTQLSMKEPGDSSLSCGHKHLSSQDMKIMTAQLWWNTVVTMSFGLQGDECQEG